MGMIGIASQLSMERLQALNVEESILQTAKANKRLDKDAAVTVYVFEKMSRKHATPMVNWLIKSPTGLYSRLKMNAVTEPGKTAMTPTSPIRQDDGIKESAINFDVRRNMVAVDAALPLPFDLTPPPLPKKFVF